MTYLWIAIAAYALAAAFVAGFVWAARTGDRLMCAVFGGGVSRKEFAKEIWSGLLAGIVAGVLLPIGIYLAIGYTRSQLKMYDR